MKHKYKAIVIGASSGGLTALSVIISALPKNFLPIITVQHIGEENENYLPAYLQSLTKMLVKEADLNEKIVKGTIYTPSPGYHLLVEPDLTLTLSVEEKIHFARPSIDVLFESAAFAYQNKLIGIILSGANDDGSSGLKLIKEAGGLTIVQDPNTADATYMPQAAIAATSVDHILSPAGIRDFLLSIAP